MVTIPIPKEIKKTIGNYDKIITRFPPQPSGFLHIGHVRALVLNRYLADIGKGEMIFRFDDTNPVLESDDFRESIKNDVHMLGIKYDKFSSTTQYLDNLIEYADKLIVEGKAYMDLMDKEKISEFRKVFKSSEYRDVSVDQNLLFWKEFKKGNSVGVLRVKLDFKHKNGSMRDPVIFRLIDGKPYPTYDFACPIVDYLEGVTHVLRSTQFSDRNIQYKEILKLFDIKAPVLYNYGLINFQSVDLSKRKIKKEVEDGILDGFDDPRIATIQGILKRGMHPIALKEFMLKMGFSNKSISMEWDKIWSNNKKYIDKLSYRSMGINFNPKKITSLDMSDLNDIVWTDYPSKDVEHWDIEIDNYQKNKELGTRKLKASNCLIIDREGTNALFNNINQKVIFPHLGVYTVLKADYTEYSPRFLIKHDKDASFKGIKDKISWLAHSNSNKIMEITTYKKREKIIKYMLVDPFIYTLNKGTYIQILQHGYYMITKKVNDIISVIDVPIGKEKDIY